MAGGAGHPGAAATLRAHRERDRHRCAVRGLARPGAGLRRYRLPRACGLLRPGCVHRGPVLQAREPRSAPGLAGGYCRVGAAGPGRELHRAARQRPHPLDGHAGRCADPARTRQQARLAHRRHRRHPGPGVLAGARAVRVRADGPRGLVLLAGCAADFVLRCTAAGELALRCHAAGHPGQPAPRNGRGHPGACAAGVHLHRRRGHGRCGGRALHPDLGLRIARCLRVPPLGRPDADARRGRHGLAVWRCGGRHRLQAHAGCAVIHHAPILDLWLGLFLVVLVLVGRDRLFKPWTWIRRGR